MLSGLENPIHLLVILVVVLLIFGPKRLPDVGRSLGHGMRQFRASLSGKEEEATAPPPAPAPAPEKQDID
jgi:sec-independent protein translocase protein TatA